MNIVYYVYYGNRNSLFALSIAPVEGFKDLFGHVVIPEMGIVIDDGLEGVIEHNSGFEEITAASYPFGGPDGTDDVGMPVAPGALKAIDLVLGGTGKAPGVVGKSGASEKHVGRRLRGLLDEERTPEA